jgi:hypothetical protein
VAMMAGPSSSGTGGLTLGPSCWCPPDMCMALVIGLHHSRFSYFCTVFKKWCCGDRSHASSVPVAHRSMVRDISRPALDSVIDCKHG